MITNTTIPVNKDVEELLYWSYYYAVGRQSYSVCWIAELITDFVNNLPDERLIAIIQDITERETRSEYALGSPVIDKPTWLKVRDVCKSALNKKGKPLTEIDDDDFTFIMLCAIRTGIMNACGNTVAKIAIKYLDYCNPRDIYNIARDVGEAFRAEITPVFPINDMNAVSYIELFNEAYNRLENKELLIEEIGQECLDNMKLYEESD